MVISAARESLPLLPPNGSRPEERGSTGRCEGKRRDGVERVEEKEEEEAPT